MSRPNCPDCGFSEIKKAGKLENKYVTKQGYRCKKCSRYFVERDGFEGKTYSKEVIVDAIHLFVEGLSPSKIREHLYQHHGGYSPSDGSILNWVRSTPRSWRGTSGNKWTAGRSGEKFTSTR